ncbi:MAG: CHASE2 domain-containing protein [Spirochaetales bacterium]|uniref:CHASE2 domain-containing protein n=1 Tax=Candidatus Thalassospirochaeta sargassi TaxID=3119039 RepID=A0AAJ1IAY7_9SPIO|nr:CHASE2 domain-containing protein [Spirochaetales bacterium]
MSAKKSRLKILDAKHFCFVIGGLILLAFYLLSNFTVIFDRLDNGMLDTFFKYRTDRVEEDLQVGVSYEGFNPNISPDILIVGIDLKTLERFGRFPFPRWRHADFLKSLSRIENQNERENSVFLDLLFGDSIDNPTYDGLLVDAFKEHGKVFTETFLDEFPPPAGIYDEYYERQQILYDGYGDVDYKKVIGEWRDVPAFYGLQPPLAPYADAARGYGHANFKEDHDDVYRRQPLLGKSSMLVETIRLDELSVDYPVDVTRFERLAWSDSYGIKHNIEYPLTESVINDIINSMQKDAPMKSDDIDGDGEPDDSYYIVEKYRDHLVPSITLSLACNYFNKQLSDLEIVIGEYILISDPEQYNSRTGSWEPYRIVDKPPEIDDDGNLVKEAESHLVEEIRIPIDEECKMLINFMGYPSFAASGEKQTYPVRSYAGYASNPPGIGSRWPRTKALSNKIVMVGAFTKGMAADQKPTPYGLMFGVEVHANALNTILMNNFLTKAPYWIDFVIMAFFVMLTAFLASRFSTIPTLFVSLVMILAMFFGSSYIFDNYNYVISFFEPAIAIVLTFLLLIAYRAMTEERDKKKIKGMFGTYLSPKVVEQIIETPPELGGVDKNLSVFFSDIRGFTTLSESMPPQELVQLLNQYLTAMTDIILDYEGTLDKYEGDAIMCFWGAPLPQEDHAFRSCCAAVKQITALKKLNTTLPPEKQINIGIGINSGIMTVGNMGSTQRMDYTLIGDNVNLAARLEGTNKQYRTQIIISEYTYGLVKDQVLVRELDNIRVKGKNKPVLIYELIDIVE